MWFNYFNPFEQYAENEVTGDVASIDPQDDFWDEVSGTEKLTPEIKKEKKSKKNKSLKEKIVKAKSEAKKFKKSDDFKKKRKELKDKKQTIPKEEVSFKYLDMALADNPPTWTENWYIKPASSNIYIPWTNVWTCWSRVPCYDQFYTYYNTKRCRSGCSPTAMGMIFWYYDKTYSNSWAYNNLLDSTTTTFLNDTNSNTMIKKIGDYMLTFCTWSDLWATYITNFTKWIQYAKDRWYTKSTATYYSWNASTLFTTIKTEINAWRPVMLSNSTHSMVWYWYNSTSWLPIVRLNMWWWPNAYITDSVSQISYKYSNIDYNISSMYYNNAVKTPINNIVTIKILK